MSSVCREASLKDSLSRPSRRDSVIAARSRIRLCESNFGEWQVGACKRERSGWQNRNTRHPPGGSRRLYFIPEIEEEVVQESPIYYDRHTRGSQLPCFWCRSLIPFMWKLDYLTEASEFRAGSSMCFWK